MRSIIRFLLAFLSAAVIPTIVFLLVMSAPVLLIQPPIPYYARQDIAGLAFVTLVIAGLHVLVLAAPIILLLHLVRSTKWILWWSSTIGGFILGCLPVALFTWPLRYPNLMTNSSYSDGGNVIQTMINGVPTLAGWISYAKIVSSMGFFGALGGLSFWANLKLSEKLPSTTPIEPVASDKPASKKISFRKLTMLFSNSAIIILAIAIFAGPVVARDRSCHNMFRDGRTSIGPVVNMNAQIPEREWPKLAELLQTFAATHHMSFLDPSFKSPDLVHSLYLSVCNEDGVNIETQEDVMRPGISITVYVVRDGAEWIPLTQQLIAALDEQWPSTLQFIGENGEISPKPTSLFEGTP